MPTTAALDHALHMVASSHTSVPSYLVNALEETMRLVANLQARVALLEGDTAPALVGFWDRDAATDEEHAEMDMGDGEE